MNTSIKSQKGFTLIELMVVVAVVGLLAAIAYPSYQDYLRRSRRVDAQIALLAAAQSMERYYTENMSYSGATAGAVFQTSSNEGYYSLAFAAGSPTTNAFTITATPVSTSLQNGDKCGTFTINHLGTHGVTNTQLNAADCWK